MPALPKVSSDETGIIDQTENQVVSDAEIEQAIMMADGLIRLALSTLYSESSFLLSTPIAGVVIPSKSNTTRPNRARLQGVQAGSAAITEQWTIRFDTIVTAVKSFTVYGSFSGTQGTGNVSTDFTSTNSKLTISKNGWWFVESGVEFATYDELYVATYDVDPRIVYVSSRLAAADVLRSLLSDAAPNTSKFVSEIESQAKSMLAKLSSGEISLVQTTGVFDPDAYAHEISTVGTRVTDNLVVSGSESDLLYDGTRFDED